MVRYGMALYGHYMGILWLRQQPTQGGTSSHIDLDLALYVFNGLNI